MAKHSKRAKAKYQRAKYSQPSTPVNTIGQTSRSENTRTQKSVMDTAIVQTSADKYRYITSDLRNIGVISGICIIILVILTFVLQ